MSITAITEERNIANALISELVNFSVTPAEEGASGFVTAVAAR